MVDDTATSLSVNYDDDGGSYDYISNDSSVILELSTDQQVWVSPDSMNQIFGSSGDEMYSWFSGRLITPA